MPGRGLDGTSGTASRARARDHAASRRRRRHLRRAGTGRPVAPTAGRPPAAQRGTGSPTSHASDTAGTRDSTSRSAGAGRAESTGSMPVPSRTAFGVAASSHASLQGIAAAERATPAISRRTGTPRGGTASEPERGPSSSSPGEGSHPGKSSPTSRHTRDIHDHTSGRRFRRGTTTARGKARSPDGVGSSGGGGTGRRAPIKARSMLEPEPAEAAEADAVGELDSPAAPGHDAAPARTAEILEVPRAAADEHLDSRWLVARLARLQAVCPGDHHTPARTSGAPGHGAHESPVPTMEMFFSARPGCRPSSRQGLTPDPRGVDTVRVSVTSTRTSSDRHRRPPHPCFQHLRSWHPRCLSLVG